MKHLTTIAVAGFMAATVLPAAAVEISGAGATFPYPIYAKWADAYKKETGVGLNYQSIGSGGGIKQIEARTVTFGATDAPLKGADLEKNRPGAVSDGDGRHRAGREPRRDQAGRAGHRRPDTRRRSSLAKSRPGTIRRSRSSTRTPSFPRRRSPSSTAPTAPAPPSISPIIWPRSAPTGNRKVGAATSVEWPVGIGAKGNEGVSNNVSPDQGLDRLCRVCLRAAEQADLHQDGEQGRQDRRADQRAFQAAAANADWNSVPGFGVILANQPGAASWPMTAATFILIPKQPPDPAATAEALKFFAWAYAKGDKMAEELDYVPMPKKVVGRHREGLGERNQGLQRQAALRARWRNSSAQDPQALSTFAVASPFIHRPVCRTLVRRPVDRLSGALPDVVEGAPLR